MVLDVSKVRLGPMGSVLSIVQVYVPPWANAGGGYLQWLTLGSYLKLCLQQQAEQLNKNWSGGQKWLPDLRFRVFTLDHFYRASVYWITPGSWSISRLHLLGQSQLKPQVLSFLQKHSKQDCDEKIYFKNTADPNNNANGDTRLNY